jgi:phenylpropionate dioxygenase-like ring-hydroxylating dioxygenase large terminal subunit
MFLINTQYVCIVLVSLCRSVWSLAVPAPVSEKAVSLNSKTFPRTWVPIASTYELDPDRPTPVEFMGQKYATYQDNDGKWIVVNDACPHRLAPLSEGRVDRPSGNLHCSYHGWEFDSTGSVARIPQMAPEAEKSAMSSKRACVTTYPSHVEKNILWIWPWEEDVLSIAGNPDAHPEGMMKGFPDDPPTYTRDLPYGWDTLVENLIDPSHVPFAHHGMQGKRTDAIPINMTIPVDKGEAGFSFEWEDRTMGMLRSGSGEFRAPYIVNYDGQFKTEAAKAFRLSAICIPTKPGWSRGIILTWPKGDSAPKKNGDEEATKVEVKKKPKKSLVGIVFSNLPVWLSHQLSNRFLDSDLAFLHFQEQERERRPDNLPYYMPAPSDRCISSLRKWIDKYVSKDVTTPLPAPLPRPAMFDRWSQHTSHCKHCQAGLERMKKVRRSTYVALTLSVLGIGYRLARVSTLMCLVVLRLLHKTENSLREGEFKHYENH